MQKNVKFCLLGIFIVLVWLGGIVQAAAPVPMGLMTNANTYLEISTYDESNQLTHPCVIYDESGWNGYTYIMAMTPYPYYDYRFENPSMRYSNDGITWVKIPGQPDPIIPQPPTGFYSDVSIERVDTTLYLFYRWSETAETLVYYNYTTTTDGIHWAQPVKTTLPPIRSSSFIYNGIGWESWGHTITGSTTVFEHFTSADAMTWVKSGTISLDTSTFVPWHSEVKKYDNKYMLLMVEDPYKDLRFFTSDDGLAWKFENDKLPVLYGRPGMWDTGIYKTSFVEVNNHYAVWYAAFDNGGESRIGYTQYPTMSGIIPVAGFTANVTTGTAPLAVKFTDASCNNPTAWAWSFTNVTGDNTEVWWSTEQNPTRTFGVGTFSIVLNASNSAGYNRSSQVTSINVPTATIAPVASFTADVTGGTAPLVVQFTDSSENTPSTWSWSFRNVMGNNTRVVFSTLPDPVHSFGVGNYSIVLDAANTAGHGISTQVTFINVTSTPVANLPDEVGVFLNGGWWLDTNSDRIWNTGEEYHMFGSPGVQAVTGDWDHDGKDEIGVFYNGGWWLDTNGDGMWNTGDEYHVFGSPSSQAVTGVWKLVL
jgi:PKD repeat protein